MAMMTEPQYRTPPRKDDDNTTLSLSPTGSGSPGGEMMDDGSLNDNSERLQARSNQAWQLRHLRRQRRSRAKRQRRLLIGVGATLIGLALLVVHVEVSLLDAASKVSTQKFNTLMNQNRRRAHELVEQVAGGKEGEHTQRKHARTAHPRHTHDNTQHHGGPPKVIHHNSKKFKTKADAQAMLDKENQKFQHAQDTMKKIEAQGPEGDDKIPPPPANNNNNNNKQVDHLAARFEEHKDDTVRALLKEELQKAMANNGNGDGKMSMEEVLALLEQNNKSGSDNQKKESDNKKQSHKQEKNDKDKQEKSNKQEEKKDSAKKEKQEEKSNKQQQKSKKEVKKSNKKQKTQKDDSQKKSDKSQKKQEKKKDKQLDHHRNPEEDLAKVDEPSKADDSKPKEKKEPNDKPSKKETVTKERRTNEQQQPASNNGGGEGNPLIAKAIQDAIDKASSNTAPQTANFCANNPRPPDKSTPIAPAVIIMGMEDTSTDLLWHVLERIAPPNSIAVDPQNRQPYHIPHYEFLNHMDPAKEERFWNGIMDKNHGQWVKSSLCSQQLPENRDEGSKSNLLGFPWLTLITKAATPGSTTETKLKESLEILNNWPKDSIKIIRYRRNLLDMVMRMEQHLTSVLENKNDGRPMEGVTLKKNTLLKQLTQWKKKEEAIDNLLERHHIPHTVVQHEDLFPFTSWKELLNVTHTVESFQLPLNLEVNFGLVPPDERPLKPTSHMELEWKRLLEYLQPSLPTPTSLYDIFHAAESFTRKDQVFWKQQTAMANYAAVQVTLTGTHFHELLRNFEYQHDYYGCACNDKEAHKKMVFKGLKNKQQKAAKKAKQ